MTLASAVACLLLFDMGRPQALTLKLSMVHEKGVLLLLLLSLALWIYRTR